MRILVIVAGIVLFVLHQDFWNWNEDGLVFGYMPVGLAYHALYSVVAALFWAIAIRFAWPGEVESWAEEEASGDGEE